MNVIGQFWMYLSIQEDEYLLHEYYLSLKAQETKSFEVDTRGFEDEEPHYYNRDKDVTTASGVSLLFSKLFFLNL